MSAPVYEVLGWYVDSVSSAKSIHPGTAEGSVYVNGERITPNGATVSLFLKRGRVEAGAVWGKRTRKAFLVRGYPEMKLRGKLLHMRFSTPKGDVLVVLKAGKKFAKAIMQSIGGCGGR